MWKRIIIFSAILVLALVIIITFIIVNRKNSFVSDPVKVIPPDAALIVQINNFPVFVRNIIEENMIFTGLHGIAPFTGMNRDLGYLDSLLRNDQYFNQSFGKSRVYISGHYIGGRKTEFLFIVENPRDAANEILSGLSQQEIKKTERKYEGKSIYNLKIDREKKSVDYYFSMVEGNLLVSRSVILIENSIRQSSMQTSLMSDKEFENIRTTAGKSKEANIFINLKKFNNILSVIANADYSRKFKEYDRFGSWMELDVNTNDKQIILNGFITSGINEKTFNSLFANNEPVNISADKVLPASVSAFLSIGARNFPMLREAYLSYLKKGPAGDVRKNALNEIKRKYEIDLEDFFLSVIDNEITVAYGDAAGENKNEPPVFVAVKCKSGIQTGKKFEEILKKIAAKKEISYSQLSETYSFDDDTKFPVIRLPLDDITGLLFGNLFSVKGTTYFTVIGNYLVFSGSRKSTEDFIYNNVLSKTLSTNEAYKSFNSNIAQNSYMIFYTNLGRSSHTFSKYLQPSLIETWEENLDIFQRMQPFGIQITSVSGMNYCNLAIQYLKDLKGRHQTVWESLLDSSVGIKPFLVENHYTKQKEIFVQDSDNTIYLINKAGRIVWKQKLTESINSKIYQIDYYRNGKLQLLFSSENYLHLIDRNGNYVERYPVRLRSSASAGMSIFDYDKNKDYRIFIPGTDNQIYVYKADGSLIDGWEFKGTAYPVNQPVEHFRIGDKDFLVFGDRTSTYILDRRGNIRIMPDKPVARSRNNNYYLDDQGNNEKSTFVTTDSLGNIIRIDFEGKITVESIRSFSPAHFFDFRDMNSDGRKDFIFLDENILEIYDRNKNEILNFSFPNDIHNAPVIFTFSASNKKIGIIDDKENRIYLINQNGTLYKGFPLEGTSSFSIGNLESLDGVFNLIVGGRNNFLYNYSVQ